MQEDTRFILVRPIEGPTSIERDETYIILHLGSRSRGYKPIETGSGCQVSLSVGVGILKPKPEPELEPNSNRPNCRSIRVSGFGFGSYMCYISGYGFGFDS
jgi:hypothetical protein